MTVQTAPTVEYFHDLYEVDEDFFGATFLQDRALRRLVAVLEWQYRTEGWYVARNLNMTRTDGMMKIATADIAVFNRVIRSTEVDPQTTRWKIQPPHVPPPRVVVKIACEETMRKDISEKPDCFAKMGVAEYFWYDPRPVRRGKRKHLRGWRNVNGQHEEMKASARGWLWSDELESWLAPDATWLRLCDRLEQQRPTAEEALQEAIAEGLAALNAEMAAKERALQEEQAGRAAKEAERAAKEQALAAVEAERAAKERAWARLRAQGIDPESME